MNTYPKSPNMDEGQRNWPVTLTLGLTFAAAVIAVPWYGIAVGYSAWAWVFFFVFLLAGGVGIGSGYHRLWSHRTYNASPALQWFLAFIGGMSLQNSILIWSARHRVHHRDVDDNDKDPYSIGRGFWFAHIGWMLRDYKSGVVDETIVPDLKKNPIVMWQHNHYLALVLFTNVVLPLALGWMVGDMWGVFLLAGLARLVINHHVTFFINSLAHMWGNQPYTDENSARDNWFLAIITYGEGYHNYHHLFQADYRNGIKWHHFDLNKWFIASCAAMGLASDLKRTPEFKIERARLDMEFKRARQRLEAHESNPKWKDLVETLEHEYEQFLATVKEWQALQVERMQHGKQVLAEKLDASFHELEDALRLQRKRLTLLTAQLAV